MKNSNSQNSSDSIIEKKNTELNKLWLVFEQTPGAIFILDREFKFEFVNPSFERLSGYSKAELIGKTVKELFYNEEIHESRREVVEAMVKGEKWQGELLTHNKNGSTYWANTIAAPFKNETGFVEGYIMIQQDITDRKAAESALRESEAKYKTLVENSQDGILIVRDNKVLYANDTLWNLLGYCPEGMPAQDLIHREDIYKVAQIGIRRRNQDFSTINESFRMLAKNGEIKECDATSTLITFKGELASFFTIHDLSENKKIQLELKESEEKYRLLFSAESDAIFMIDADTGQILDINPATTKMYGYTRDELLQMKNTDISAEPEKTAEATKNNETRVNFRLHKRKDGTVFPVELSAGFTKFKNNNIQIVTSRDISERIKNEEALAKSEAKYRELTEMLPLTVYELNADNVPTYINKAGRELFGLNSTNSGNKAMSFFVPNDRERMNDVLNNENQNAQNLAQNADPNPSDPAEYSVQKPDGTTIPVLIYGTAIVENGKPVGSRGVIVDISERKAMEIALRQSEQKYRELADFLPQTVFELDINGNLLYVNKSGVEIMGVSDADMGRSVLRFFVPEDHKRMAENLSRRARENRPNAMNEYTALREDGKTFPVIIYALSVMKEGNPVGTRGIIIDISERKAMENALRESEEKYKTLIENSQDGIFAIVEDKVLFANSTFCKMVGYTADELYRKSAVSMVHPDDRTRGLAISELRKQGNHATMNDIFRFIAKDGSIKEGDVFSSVMELNGQVVSYITVHDLTELKRAESELKIAKTELEKLNSQLEKRVKESSKRLTEARTQLINLQKENLQTQYDVLKQQVNPHFLFNSLNVLTSLIKLEPDLAEKFSEQLSKVYRYVLENKDNELVDLNTELNFLDAYIFLLNIRFVGKLNVSLSIPEANRNDKIIPLAMQLLIENAIKHNVMSKMNPLMIDIFIDELNYLNIINNLQERPSQIVSTGVGLKNILNRYKLLELPTPTFEKTENQFIAKIHLIK